jgi:serine/threonine-protein kinase
MGTLYLAHDPVLDRNIALKLLLGDIDLPGARERFVREARAAAALSNPNIVTIYDYGDYESQPYIVMEYIHGETLAELIRRRPQLPVPVRLRWMEELCSAVGYAHARGIIHRDIKPPNLMIDAYGQIKVLDFGIARMQGTLVTNATALIGTPGYTAPEQIRGGQIDHRSDLFSIGVVCYELLAYTEAFPGDTVHVITNKILNEDPLPLSRLCSVDSELEAAVMKALQKSADARFASTDALRQALADARARLEADSDAATMRYISPVGPISPRRASPSVTPSHTTPGLPRRETSRPGPPPTTRTIEARNRDVPNRPIVAEKRASALREHRRAIVGAAAVIGVAAIIGTGLLLRTPPTPSLVVLDATPWATITSIQNGDGEPQPLAEMRSTPLAVRLTPGAYTVSFEGPPPQSEKRTIEIRVESGAALTAPVQRFAAPSVDEYFRPYLIPPGPFTEPRAPAE